MKGYDGKKWWMEFLISVLGTSIGVGLTFAVTKMVDVSNQSKAQRLTAMMVIDDMEKNLEVINHIRDEEQKSYEATQYVMQHIDRIDSIAIDTLVTVFNYIVEGSYMNPDLEFSEAGERVFQTTQEAWNNLNDVTFIRNVEEFYKSRAMFSNAIQTFYFWQKPVRKAESDSLLTTTDMLDSPHNYASFLKDKLQQRRTERYMAFYANRMLFYGGMSRQWTDWCEANKFLMNISDKQMKRFREKTSGRDHPAKRSDIVGSWVYTIDNNQSVEFHFRKDRTLTCIQIFPINHIIFSGSALLQASVEGTWDIRGDSVVLDYDPSTCTLHVDENGIAYRDEMRDSVQSLLRMYECESQLQQFRQNISGDNAHHVNATNLDITGTKLELAAKKGETIHLERVK